MVIKIKPGTSQWIKSFHALLRNDFRPPNFQGDAQTEISIINFLYGVYNYTRNYKKKIIQIKNCHAFKVNKFINLIKKTVSSM